MTRLADIAIGDTVYEPDGTTWAVVDTYVEPRFGTLVSVTVAKGEEREVLDADPAELRWDDGAWRSRHIGWTSGELAEAYGR
jgi:hypothetical protein